MNDELKEHYHKEKRITDYEQHKLRMENYTGAKGSMEVSGKSLIKKIRERGESSPCYNFTPLGSG